MAKLLKLRRGTTSQHSSFTGAEGEVTVDTTKDTLVVHDGSTAGGIPLAKETGSVATANVGTHVTVTANNTADETVYPVFVDGATGTQGIETDTGLNYNPNTGKLTAIEFIGNIDATDGDFDGTLEADAITVNGTALNTVIAGVTVTNATNAVTATNANHVSVADNENTNENNLITFIENASATGNVGLESDGDFHYNPSTGLLTTPAISTSGNITIAGNLTVNGTTSTVASTNTTITDNLIELNSGASSNANDSGILIERGSTGDNAIIAWDESADKFALGTTTSTNTATGDITISTGTVVANVEGNVTGTVTGTSTGLAGSPNITVGTVGCGAITGTSTIADAKGNLRSIPATWHNASTYTLAASDAGKFVSEGHSGGNITVPASVFATGDAVTIMNHTGGIQTITQGSGVTMYNAADGTTGNRTLATRGLCTILFREHNVVYISGSGLS